MLGDHRIYRPQHAFIYSSGAQAVPLLVGELDRIELQTFDRPEAAKVVIGLATLLHDLDEEASSKFLTRALSNTCDPLVESGLRALQRFFLNDFRQISARCIEIFEQQDIDSRHEVSPYIARWSRRFRPEATLYHEIGHHFHGHKESGQVPQQEKEANEYKRKMMRKLIQCSG